MKYLVVILLGVTLWTTRSHAQTIRSQKAQKALEEFRRKSRTEYENYRQKCLKEYADFVCNPWKAFKETEPVPVPKKDETPPVIMSEDDRKKPLKDNSVIIDEIVAPIPVVPLPQPIEPVKDVPIDNQPIMGFSFYGTDCKVRFDKSKLFLLHNLKEESVAQAFEHMGNQDYDNLLIDCLRLREDLQLNDWAYLQLLKELSSSIAPDDDNVATLLVAYLFMQSGYKMRLGLANNRLYLLFASRHLIFGQSSYRIGEENYYGIEKLPNTLRICLAAFPKEKSLSLSLNCQPRFHVAVSDDRVISSKSFTDMSFNTHVNKNLIDFYNAYPTSMIDNNVMTQWATYANTPISKDVEEQLYTKLRLILEVDTPFDAVSKLLNWIQTGFVYEYDNKVWGHDRVFFAEESLYYPYCDCEDRSILFTRLVRDLIGLDCILVYYPGHLAAAVAFPNGQVHGDYIELSGKRFVICDPTYIGAPIGKTMPKMDNQRAKVILLD